jgi:ATP-dependent DNA helicase RecG
MNLEYDTHIQYLKGVGPKLGDVLRKRGVGTVGKLLEWFPRAYEDRRRARNIASLEANQIVSIEATILNVRSIQMGRSHRKMYEVTVGDKSGRITCKYFRTPYKGYFERFLSQQKVRVAGKVTLYRSRLEFHHPDIQPLYPDDSQPNETSSNGAELGGTAAQVDSPHDESNHDQLIPLYTDTEGISPFKLRKLMELAVIELIVKQHLIPEVFPRWMLDKYELLSKAKAFQLIHKPPADAGEDYLNFRSPAQKRIIFEEFFWLELYMSMERLGIKREHAEPCSNGRKLVDQLLKTLPFQLTKAQLNVFEEIYADLQIAHPMHRLVQGDVGSGKTLVALMAACVAKESGMQTALMVPTEILAEQHLKNAEKFLVPLGVRVGSMLGGLTTKEHAAVREKLSGVNAAGEKTGPAEIDLVIGTHALIEEDVVFKNLGLVVIDEQHRFGVEQRNKLKKNSSPHFLVMTATPIPRTLAMTVYGDLDISTINELPPGRAPIATRKAFSSKRKQVFDFMSDQILKGRQAYVVYPLVEESEKIDLKNAVTEFETLKGEYPNIIFGLLHGKMKSDEKDFIMQEFRTNKIQVLVSTTVIEVGVDVPNANMMIIEHSERFGLSQLHQLRGRVGRGEHKSFCILLMGHAVSEEAIHRVEVIEGTTDGFKIAEADLEIRGPGEFLGRRQSGMPGFKMGNLVRDMSILQESKKAAMELLSKDPDLKLPEHRLLREALEVHKKSIVG